MNTFFTELATGMADRQNMKFTITKVGEELTVMVVTNGKICNANSSPEEMDIHLIGEILKMPTAKTKFSATISDEKKSDKKEEDRDDDAEDEDSNGDSENDVKEEKPKADKKKATSKGGKKEVAASKKVSDKSKEIIAEEEETAGPEMEVLPEVKNDTEANVPKVSQPAKADPKAESARIDNEFKVLMHEGKQLFTERKYQEAVEKFQRALTLKPAEPEALAESNKAYKWVKALQNADL